MENNLDNLELEESNKEIPKEQPVISPVIPTSHRSKLPLVLFAVFLLFLFGLGGIYLGKYLSALQITAIPTLAPQPTLEPTIIPTITPDPTANWKTYTNIKYGYTFKYPESINKSDKFTDDLIEINGSDNLVIQISSIQTTETDPSKWWNSQQKETYTKKSISCFSKESVTVVKSLYDPGKVILDFGKNILVLNNLNSKESACAEPPEIQILLIPNNGKIIKIAYDMASFSEEILSTFKFINSTNNSKFSENSIGTNGKYFGYIKNITYDNNQVYLSIDLAQMFGDNGNDFSGTKACVEDGKCPKTDNSCQVDNNGNCVPNEFSKCDGIKCATLSCGTDKSCLPGGYYIRNLSKQLTKLPLSESVIIKDYENNMSNPSQITLVNFENMFATNNEKTNWIKTAPFWFTLSNNKIIQVSQQYLP